MSTQRGLHRAQRNLCLSSVVFVAACVQNPVVPPPPPAGPAPPAELVGGSRSSNCDKPLVISIDSRGTFLDGVLAEGGAEALRRAITNRSCRSLVIQASPGSTVEPVEEALSIARVERVNRVTLDLDGQLHETHPHSKVIGESLLELVSVQGSVHFILWPRERSKDGTWSGKSRIEWRIGNSSSESEVRAWMERRCDPDSCSHLSYTAEQSSTVEQSRVILERLSAVWPETSARPRLRVHFFPRIDRSAVPAASGRLPPELIQTIVRAAFNEHRLCYQAGLARNPKLSGRVIARFIIDPTGTVSKVEDENSTLPDAEVVACSLEVFARLVFPAPEAGSVKVVYPIMLQPE